MYRTPSDVFYMYLFISASQLLHEIGVFIIPILQEKLRQSQEAQKYTHGHTVGSDGTGIPARGIRLQNPEGARHSAIPCRIPLEYTNLRHILVTAAILLITNKPLLHMETYPFLLYKYFRGEYKVLDNTGETHISLIKLPAQLCNRDTFARIDSIGSLLLLSGFRQLPDFLNNAVCSFVFPSEL